MDKKEFVTSKDIRNRYFFKFESEGDVIWEGYLLHDEAWNVLKRYSNPISMIWGTDTSLESDYCPFLD